MAESHPRVRATVEGGAITLVTLYVAMLLSGQLRVIRDDVWVVGGLAGMLIAYLYARTQKSE